MYHNTVKIHWFAVEAFSHFLTPRLEKKYKEQYYARMQLLKSSKILYEINACYKQNAFC